MQIEFIDAYPFQELQPTLERFYSGARRVDAAVAFVTRHGVETVVKLLQRPTHPTVRLVVSVRFPTDIAALCRLEPRMIGNLFIHTGYDTPQEKDADRGQFHSKVVLIETNDTDRCILVGSHNWTEHGLRGVNIEAGVLIRCTEADDIVRQVRAHIDGCVARSEPFDPKRERYYRAVQSVLRMPYTGPESSDFEGFEECAALIIHAEDNTGNSAPDLLQLFVPVERDVAATFFPVGRRVLLYLYPAGALFGHSAPTLKPELFDGEVTMNNNASDALVDRRAANSMLENLEQPAVRLHPTGSVPVTSGGMNQVVLRLSAQGQTQVPILHSAQQAPKLKLGIECNAIDRDRVETRQVEKADVGSVAQPRPPSREFTYTAPARLTVTARINMPEEAAGDVATIARRKRVAYAGEFMRNTDVPEIEIKPPAKELVLNRYVYRAFFRLTDESEARIQRQRPLIAQ